MLFRLDIAYNGKNYFGSQKQANKPTIQGELEKVLCKINKQETKTTICSRTDAGVHALQQVITFESDLKLTQTNWINALASHLPNDIKVINIREVSPEFHPRYHVTKKRYKYVINTKDRDIFNLDVEYTVTGLSSGPLEEISKLFQGEHDFLSFSKYEPEKNTIRTLDKINIISKDGRIYIYFEGKGFLRYMIRNIVGAMVYFAKGKYTREELKYLLDNPTKDSNIFKAPPQGLFLEEILYD